jgi:hypothetical protein
VRYFSRYISKSPVILGNKSDYERKIITSYKLNFPQLTIGMRDSFQQEADRVQHIGLEFIIEEKHKIKKYLLKLRKIPSNCSLTLSAYLQWAIATPQNC